MANDCRRLHELLELNRRATGRSLAFEEVSRSSGSIAEGGGIYLMWDPVENRWVRAGETETLRWRLQEHWKWNTRLFDHVGHAICHSSGRENLIQFLYMDTWKGVVGQEREDLEQLRADIKQHVARWTLTWIPTPERQIGLRLFLEANMIAVLSTAYGSTEQWKGIGKILATCNCGRNLRASADTIARSRLWNVEKDLIDGRPTSGWLEFLEKQIG